MNTPITLDRLLRSPTVVPAGILAIAAGSSIAVYARGLHPIFHVALGVGVLCIVGYLVLRDRICVRRTPHRDTFRNSILAAGILILAGLVVYALRSEQYVKPVTYYVITACATGALALAASKADSKGRFAAVLALASITGLAHIWTESLLFPSSLIGIDSWHHMSATAQLPDQTEVPIGISTLGGAYSLLHLYLNAAMTLFHIEYKTASLVFGGSVQVVGNIVLAGLVGSALWGKQAGASAAVVLSVANWNLFFGEWTIPNAAGATLSLFAACLILVNRSHPAWAVRIPLVVIVIVMALLTHIIAAGWVLVTALCLLAPHLIRAFRQRKSQILLGSLAALLLLALPAWLLLTTNGNSLTRTVGQLDYSPSFGLTYVVAQQPAAVITPPAGVKPTASPEPAQELLHRNTLGEMTFDSIGMLLYIGLALIGSVIMLRRRNTADRMWVLLGLTVLAIGFFPPLLGRSFLEHRWWYFAEVLLAIPLGALLVLWIRRFGAALPVAFVVLIAFTSTIGLPANVNNRVLSPNLIVRYGMTDSEMQALYVVKDKSPALVGSDPLYYNVLINNTVLSRTNRTTVSIGDNLVTGDFSQVKADLIVLRKAVYTEPFGFGGGTIYRVPAGILGTIKSYGYHETWSNEDVYILERG